MAKTPDYSEAYFYHLMNKTRGNKKEAIDKVLGDQSLSKYNVNRNEVLRRLGVNPPPSPAPAPVAPKPQPVQQPKQSFASKAWTFGGKVLDLLNRPVYATMNTFKNMAQAEGGLDTLHPWQSFKRGLSGVDKTTGKDLLEAWDVNNVKNGYMRPQWVDYIDPVAAVGHALGKTGRIGDPNSQLNKFWNNVVGFGTDLLAPPTGIASGLTKLGKLANVAKGGQEILSESKLAKEIARFSPEALKLGTTKAEQAALGQRHLLSYWGIPLLPKAVEAPIYKAGEAVANKIGQTLPNIPVANLPGYAFVKGFGQSAQGKEAERLLHKYKKLENEKVFDTIKSGRDLAQIQKDLGIDKAALFNMIEKTRKPADLTQLQMEQAGFSKMNPKDIAYFRRQYFTKENSPDTFEFLHVTPNVSEVLNTGKLQSVNLFASEAPGKAFLTKDINTALDYLRAYGAKAGDQLPDLGVVQVSVKRGAGERYKTGVRINPDEITSVKPLPTAVAKTNLARTVGNKYSVLTPTRKLDQTLQKIKPMVEGATKPPAVRRDLVEYVWNGLGGVKSGISKDEVRKLKRADLEEMANGIPRPSVADAARVAAQKLGVNLDDLMDGAAKTSSADYLQRIKDMGGDNARWARVVGIKSAPKATQSLDSIASELPKDFAALPPEQQEALRRFWQENERNLAIERVSGVPARELGQDDINYMMHALLPDAARKAGNKKYWRQMLDNSVEGYNRVANRIGAKQVARKVNSVLSPVQLERKYKGTAAEINQQVRDGLIGASGKSKIKRLFNENPAEVQTMRNQINARLTNRADFLHDVINQFGVDAKNAPEGFREIKNKNFAGILRGKAFDPGVARVIEKEIKIFSDPDELKSFAQGFWKAFDTLQSLWKKTTLVAFPAYHFRNVAGNFWMNYLGDVSPAAYKDAASLMMNKAGGIKTAAGHTYSNEEIKRLGAALGVENRGWFTSEVSQIFDDGVRENSGNLLDKALSPGMKAQEMLENHARYAHFIDKLIKGYSPEQAAESVKKFLYDPSNMTDFERTWARRAIPFYAWSRHNIPLELEQLVLQPGKFGMVSRSMDRVEQEGEKQGRPNELFMQDWLREGMPVYYGADDTTGRYFMTKGWWPGADIQQAVQPGEAVIEGLSPIAKLPYELATNTSTYFNRPIDRSDQSLNAPDYKNFLGVNMPTRYAYALSNIRALNELDRLNPVNIFGQRKSQPSESARWLNALTGIKSYTYDPAWDAKQYKLDITKEINRKKYAAKRANEEGNQAAVNKAMEQIKKMMNDPRTKAIRDNQLFFK